MKKIRITSVWILILLMLVLMLTGCNPESGRTEQSSVVKQNTDTQADGDKYTVDAQLCASITGQFQNNSGDKVYFGPVQTTGRGSFQMMASDTPDGLQADYAVRLITLDSSEVQIQLENISGTDPFSEDTLVITSGKPGSSEITFRDVTWTKVSDDAIYS
ncbi:MAG: hypothetical protein ACOYB8_05270 [Eubacteriaceae bacterium]|jgi:hypothetical protein